MKYIRRRKLRGLESPDDLHADTNLVRLSGRRGELCGTIIDRPFIQPRMTRHSRDRHRACPCSMLIGSW